MARGILCGGEALIDMTSESIDADLASSSYFLKTPGGAPLNWAVAASRLGANVSYLGKIGTDKFGDYLWKIMKRENLDTSLSVRKSDTKTTLAFVAVDSHGKPDFSFYRDNAADVSLTFDEIDKINPEDWYCYCFGSISLLENPSASTYLKVFDIFNEANVLTVFDPNIRPLAIRDGSRYREVLRYILERADIVKMSDDDLIWMVGDGTIDDMISRLAIKDDGLLYLTCGSSGALIKYGGEVRKISPWKVDPLNTTGCGDAFMGAVLAHIYRDRVRTISDLDMATVLNWGSLACASAALVATREGSCSSMPYSDELSAFTGGIFKV